jgi:hypothetical protein
MMPMYEGDLFQEESFCDMEADCQENLVQTRAQANKLKPRILWSIIPLRVK